MSVGGVFWQVCQSSMCKFREQVRDQDGESVWGLTHTVTMIEITERDLIKGEREKLNGSKVKS